MGMQLAVRSLGIEAARVCELDFDPEVVAICTEVGRIPIINPQAIRGGKHRHHVPDIVVVYRDHVVLEVCKSTEDILTQMKDPAESWKWARDDSGDFLFPPLALALANQGLDVTVRVVTQRHVSRRLVDNLTYLASYLHATPTSGQMTEAANVVKSVAFREGIKLCDLIAGGCGVDAVQRAIAHRALHVDLRRYSIRDAVRTHVYSSAEAAELHSTVATNTVVPKYAIARAVRPLAIGDALSIRLGGESVAVRVKLVASQNVRVEIMDGDCIGQETQVTRTEAEAGRLPASKADVLQDLKTKVAEILTSAGRKALAVARGRARVLQKVAEDTGCPLDFPLNVDEGECADVGTPSARTCARWMAAAKQYHQEFGSAFAGLVPRNDRKGNRGERFSGNLQEFVFACLATLQRPENVPQARTQASRYDYVLEQMVAQRVKGPTDLYQISYKLFRKICRRYGRRKMLLAAEGLAAANQELPPAERLEHTTPIHGTYFLQRVHADHTPLSVSQLCALIGIDAGRFDHLVLDTCWFSAMIDAYTRKVLGVMVSFSTPNWTTVASLLRQCVDRHGQLPAELVLDNGKEFRCHALQQLCAWGDVKVIYRMLKQPRGGSLIERFFGLTESQLSANLPGSTRLRAKNFFYAQDMPPGDHARLTLEATAILMREFCFQVYDGKVHPSLGVAPEQMRVASLATHGRRPERDIRDMATFRALTMLRPRNLAGLAKIQSKYGIQFSGFRYWHDLFDTAENESRSVPVRFDPDDMSVAYAMVIAPGGCRMWVRATCRQLAECDFLPELEQRFATEIAQNLALARFLAHKRGRRAISNFVARWRRIPASLEELARTLADARAREILLGAPDPLVPEAIATENLPDPPTGSSGGATQDDIAEEGGEVVLD